jgi:mannose-6-phosphate isomerase-like protein (cupin superfamily)
MPTTEQQNPATVTLVRHASEAHVERSTCGTRHRLISDGDEGVAAWAHTVDLQDGLPHYHKIAAELYYVLEGEGSIELDGEAHPLEPGSIVHIPPGVVHVTKGRMKALIVGIPDIRDDDVYVVESETAGPADKPAGD